MKQLAKLLVAVALVAGLNNAFAQGRKEVTMDAGKGGFKLTVSVPDDRDGPYDFAKNKGPVVNDQKGAFVVGETMFLGGISPTAGFAQQARIDRSYETKTEDQKITAEKLAQIIIKQKGFSGREVKIPCPPAYVDDAEMVCYKMSGSPIFKGEEIKTKHSIVLASIAFGKGRFGYTLIGSVYEKDQNKFNSDPTGYEKRANGVIVDLYKNHRVNLN